MTLEDPVGEVEQTRERLRTRAREAIGITGRAEMPSLRETVVGSGVGWYPLLALGLLVIVDEFQTYAFLVLGPEVSATLGVSKSVLGGIQALKLLAITLAALPMAAYVQKRPRRALVAVVTAFGWSAMTLFTGFVVNVWGLLANLIADGASTGSVRAVHQPLLVDSYPPETRMRVLSFYRGADGVGNILAPLLVAILTTVAGFTWRGVFVALGLFCLLAALASARLRDPGYGTFDTDRVRETVRIDAGYAERSPKGDSVKLGFFESVRRLMLIPTLRRILVANAVLGTLLIPLYTYLFFFLEERWGMGPGGRGLLFAIMPIPTLAALRLFGPWGERLFRRDPSRVVTFASLFLGVGVVSLAFAMYSPVFAGMAILLAIAFVLLALLTPALNLVLLSIVPPLMRPHASALAGVFLAAVGGFGGLILLGGVERRFGTAGAIASLAIPGIVAALVLRTARSTVDADLDRMLDEIVEDEELRALTHRGAHLPMLSCRGLDFAYGQLQVLFEVAFSVDDGEMVALLGTNGAGKSTLLRVISGLGLPTKGSIRLSGADITYLDPERRLNLGIMQIPGGRAVFPPLTVAENLRLYGWTHGRDRSAVDRGIDAAFEVFPRLGERRGQLAVTLSGGEQQMLAIARAFILKPRLLLIDELSLGLSPKIVSDLLGVVRSINQAGTAVVLVEQSVNVALSLVDHAYFMEKGEIRFDGRASDLLQRSDLLRSVFLEGAARGVAQR